MQRSQDGPRKKPAASAEGAEAKVECAAAKVADKAARAEAKVADKAVHHLHFNDWRDVIKSSRATARSSEPEPWMVYLTGGNKTCMGFCDTADAAWNVSHAICTIQI